jgi:hypothetical protein
MLLLEVSVSRPTFALGLKQKYLLVFMNTSQYTSGMDNTGAWTTLVQEGPAQNPDDSTVNNGFIIPIPWAPF